MPFQRLLLLPLVALVMWCLPSQAQPVGSVAKLSGVLLARSPDGVFRVLATNSQVREGDTLSTQPDTYALVVFKDDAEVLLQPGTTLVVTRYTYDPDQPARDKVELRLVKGGVRSTAGKLASRNADATVLATPQGDLKGNASMVVSLEPARP
jgi:hypothetical protein